MLWMPSWWLNSLFLFFCFFGFFFETEASRVLSCSAGWVLDNWGCTCLCGYYWVMSPNRVALFTSVGCLPGEHRVSKYSKIKNQSILSLFLLGWKRMVPTWVSFGIENSLRSAWYVAISTKILWGQKSRYFLLVNSFAPVHGHRGPYIGKAI